ncbi:MAG: hypothetical protein F6K11_35060 [Leptolyngbya sp. SIO3F4]|nr:hypothetical protein [Leptolyngbya sp. SIO3F4]
MGKFYQNWDIEIIDYDMYTLKGLDLRGPKLVQPDYIAYLGAAQTFGRYCRDPFPTLIGQQLALGTLNLGSGGKGPQYYLQNPQSLDLVNNAKFAVVQVMSGRSISNSIFKSIRGGRSGIRLKDGKKTTSNAIFYELVSGQDERGLDLAFLEQLVVETRENYVKAMIELLEKIQVPTVLLWFSVRSPGYQEIYPAVLPRKINRWLEKVSKGKLGLWRRQHETRVERLLGDFPHLVNQTMVDQLKRFSDHYVEYIGQVGLPQPLKTYAGRSLEPNIYYPSPEMHREVYDKLLPICQSLLD